MQNLKITEKLSDGTQQELCISDVRKSFLFCLEKAMGYAYASATEGVSRKEAQEDFRIYREEMLAEFQKRNV